MALGTVTIFNESMRDLMKAAAPNADGANYKVAVLKSTSATPIAAFVAPDLTDFTQVGAAGTYTAGGLAATLTWVESTGTTTWALSASPAVTWAAHASNDTDARWLLIYETVGGKAVGFVDLNANVDMTAGPLTLNPGTVFTLAKAA